MGDALCLCRTAEDFEAYLEVNQGSNLGLRANFRVMETDGKAWWFEEFAKPQPDRDEWIDCIDRPCTAAAVVPVGWFPINPDTLIQ